LNLVSMCGAGKAKHGDRQTVPSALVPPILSLSQAAHDCAVRRASPLPNRASRIAAATLAVQNARYFAVGATIQIDNEHMIVTGVEGCLGGRLSMRIGHGASLAGFSSALRATKAHPR
jgi:hypothetical protein